MTSLLDANVLIALTVSDHVHHQLAEDWFTASEQRFATCPITQGALVRFLLRAGAGAREALGLIEAVRASPRHDFWADDVPLDLADLRGVIGHRQVTDAYLAALARTRGASLLTLDQGLAALHADVGVLLN